MYKTWMETFLCDTERFSLERRRSFHSFYYMTLCILKQSALFMHLLVQLLPVWMLPVHSQHCSPTVCMHTHRTDFITSFPSQTLCYTERDREPALWFFFPFALMHVSLMLQPLKSRESYLSVLLMLARFVLWLFLGDFSPRSLLTAAVLRLAW